VYLEHVVPPARRSPATGLSALVAPLVCLACAGDPRTVDVCARGDREDLVDALVGGSLELVFRDARGEEVARSTADVDRPTSLSAAVPEGARAVDVSGRDRAGAEVAIGGAPIEEGSACVCLALSSQHRAACAGLRCQVVDDQCRFLDDEGDPVGARTIVFGDNPGDDLAGAVRDTWLSDVDDQRDANFGAAERLFASGAPARTALFRFDLAGLPRTSAIDRAELQLTACGENCRAAGAPPGFPRTLRDQALGRTFAGGTLGVFRALEEWDEGPSPSGASECASWNCRVDGVSWSVPGCGYRSGRNRSRDGAASALVDAAGPGQPIVADVTALAADWLADPTANLGVAVVADEEAAVALVSREGEEGARPRLFVTFRLDDVGSPVDAGVDAGVDAAPDAGVDPPEMVRVQGGSFLMGCNRGECEADEKPVHAVTLAPFEIDRTEVTQGAYRGCVDAGECAEPSCAYDPVDQASYPVSCVRHEDARAYCAFAGKRLPTEAEWEKAARSDDRQYPWGNRQPDCTLANAFGCAGLAQPVGLHPDGVSPYGAVDMAGNVSEYVADFYAADYYASSPAANPTGPADGEERVRRGGGHSGGRDTLSVFDRIAAGPFARGDNIGFRCARDAP
jgi:sulfatase modifying factor 1